jgi:hypothetical protein
MFHLLNEHVEPGVQPQLSASYNKSFNDVSSQFGPGGDFAGWRYTTSAELTTFFLDFGITQVYSPM